MKRFIPALNYSLFSVIGLALLGLVGLISTIPVAWLAKEQDIDFSTCSYSQKMSVGNFVLACNGNTGAKACTKLAVKLYCGEIEWYVPPTPEVPAPSEPTKFASLRKV